MTEVIDYAVMKYQPSRRKFLKNQTYGVLLIISAH